MKIEEDRSKLRQLRVGEECYLHMCEGGGARVERHDGYYDLYDVFIYGTGERFEKSFQTGDEASLLALVYSWT